MSAPRVWLIEAIDGAGAASEDARIHARALASTGFEVRTFLAGPTGLEELVTSRRANGAAGRPDLALAASSYPGGGAAARHLPRGTPWGWWPTGIANAARWRIGRQAPALPFGNAASCPGLTASTSEAAPRKRPVPLWDGEVLLVPSALERRNGAELLRAFAAVAAERSALDLVVLGEPQPAFTALARAAGVGARLHFAGPATREAEHAWLGSAAALLVDTEAPVSGGLVLRALGRGVPVVPVGRDGAGTALRSWLVGRGCLEAGHDRLVQLLAWALASGPDAARARRSVAAEHDLASLGRRLGAVLGRAEARAA